MLLEGSVSKEMGYITPGGSDFVGEIGRDTAPSQKNEKKFNTPKQAVPFYLIVRRVSSLSGNSCCVANCPFAENA